MKHPDRPHKPEMPHGEYPHPHFRRHFQPPEEMEHRHRFSRRHHLPREFMPHDFDFYLALADELSLSEEQVKKLHSIMFERHKNRITAMAKIQVGELELRDLLNQNEVDLANVDAKIKEIGEGRTENHIADVHAMIDAREVLTQEQKKKLKNLRPILCNGHF